MDSVQARDFRCGALHELREKYWIRMEGWWDGVIGGECGEGIEWMVAFVCCHHVRGPPLSFYLSLRT